MKFMKRNSLFLCFVFLSLSAAAQSPQLWGTHTFGGSGVGQGNIFRINGDGTGYAEIHACAGFLVNDCNSPLGNIVPASSTLFYGMTGAGGSNGLGEIFSYNTAARVYTSLFTMDSAAGNYPRGSLLLADDNQLYGLTSDGGLFDMGVLFRFDPATNQYAKLHEFDSITGRFPNSSLIQGDNGKLYGTAPLGGASNFGTLFSYDFSSSSFEVLFNFNLPSGYFPYGKLLKAGNGLFYGTTTSGGGTGASGSIYSFDPVTNQHTLLHGFTDGGFPYWGSLAEGAGGILYGATSQGGSNSGGVIFSYQPANNTFTKLHDFAQATGWKPRGNVILASDGNLYGATTFGGNNNFGVVYSFNLTTSAYTVLYHGSIAQGGYCDNELVEYDAVTSVEKFINQKSFTIYPNPSNGTVFIRQEVKYEGATTVSILNMLGQTVETHTLSSENSELQFDMPSGIFIITLQQYGKVWMEKVVVK